MSKKNYREWLGANIQTVSTRDGTKIAIDDLFEKNDVIGLYFGASWCGPCAKFLSTLKAAYARLQEEGQNFELVYISRDKTPESFYQYFSQMPWLSPSDFPVSPNIITSEMQVYVIPTLILLRKDGTIITHNGRGAIRDRLAEYPWPNLVDEPAFFGVSGLLSVRKLTYAFIAFLVIVLYFVLNL
eukprot:m.32857 g.32857  ORF g.32857 m.32857 type:complete len:185 (+) comp9554_c0_seq4:346-900(+)